jgi:hypothetical protein
MICRPYSSFLGPEAAVHILKAGKGLIKIFGDINIYAAL